MQIRFIHSGSNRYLSELFFGAQLSPFTFAFAMTLIERSWVRQRVFCLLLLSRGRPSWGYDWGDWRHPKARRHRQPRGRSTARGWWWRVGGTGSQNTAHAVKPGKKWRDKEVLKWREAVIPYYIKLESLYSVESFYRSQRRHYKNCVTGHNVRNTYWVNCSCVKLVECPFNLTHTVFIHIKVEQQQVRKTGWHEVKNNVS